MLLDIFEDQLEIGRLIVMADARQLLDQQLRNLNRTVLQHGGQVKTAEAKAKAEREYCRFDAERRKLRHSEADATIRELQAADKTLPTRPRPKR